MASKHELSELMEALHQQIASGRYQNGDRLPSERDLAAEFQASRPLVKEAILRLERIGILRRLPNCRPIIAYDPAKHAPKSVAKPVQKRDQIAVWLQPDFQDFGAARILHGIKQELAKHDYKVVVGWPPSQESDVEEETEAAFLRAMARDPSVAGTIVWDASGSGRSIPHAELGAANIPSVFIDRAPAGPNGLDVVSTDHRAAARNLVRHLIELGHRQIAMVVNEEPASSVRDRILGYREALIEAGIEPDPELLLTMEVNQWGRSGTREEGLRQFARQLVDHSAQPTAVFAVNDMLAISLREELVRQGLRIPTDLSVAGFDWLFRWVPSGGDLTTVAQPFEAIGEAAAQLLIFRIGGQSPFVSRQVLLEAPVVVRSSTAAPRHSALPPGDRLYSR